MGITASDLFKNIEMEYIRYCKHWGQNVDRLPFGRRPDGAGGYHLEIHDDGKMALVGTDRDMETERRETYSIDELLYWIFQGSANSRAGMYEPSEMKDPRQAWFHKALDEIEKLNPAWRNRLDREQQEILRKHPFSN